jgi:AcrR family transcriptional regulator
MQDKRIVEAALRCVARWGVNKTTLDDVAREAGLSRATIYRLVPGGKDGLMELVARVEITEFFQKLAERLEAATSLEELLVTGMTEAGRHVVEHPALQFIIAYEPEIVLPGLAFAQMARVLRLASAFAAPYLARFIPPKEAPDAAEWVIRMLLSYAGCPSERVDMSDEESVRRLVRTFILPALLQTAATTI